jgi:hypothetical protein
MMIELDTTALQYTYDEDGRVALVSTNTCNIAPRLCAMLGDGSVSVEKVHGDILEAQLKSATGMTYTRFSTVNNRCAIPRMCVRHLSLMDKYRRWAVLCHMPRK